ncbi:MAG: hypothetical protein ACR2FN_11490 [Chitinophagaceae bacterium]
MAELIVNISSENEFLVKELVEKLGGSVKQKRNGKIASKKKQSSKKIEMVKSTNNKPSKTRRNKNNKKQKIDHTFLFGKWKDYDIDARKLREESW